MYHIDTGMVLYDLNILPATAQINVLNIIDPFSKEIGIVSLISIIY